MPQSAVNGSVVVLTFKVPIIHCEGESTNDIQAKKFLKLASQQVLKKMHPRTQYLLHHLGTSSAQEYSQKQST